ncbi:MAG TPA: restriction endonuclease [Ktedonobacterales bacterium]|nr:restriction endonuclease [Ktedonobacterales bacterium]
MRWFWQRRRQRQATIEPGNSATVAQTAHVERAPSTSGRLGQPRQLTSEVLVLARDYLQAIGARLRVEDEDVLSAILVDGSQVRYTTTLAKARVDESMTLLVEGSEAFTAMLEDITAHARMSALRLELAADPVTLALDQCASPAPKCGRCLGASEGSPVARCETCPRREGRLVLRWRATGALTGRAVRHEQAQSVELTYLVAARDHRGRYDEWFRCATDTATGKSVPVLAESVLAEAHAEALHQEQVDSAREAISAPDSSLEEAMAATGMFLRQRSLDEYLKRQEDVATTFDRLQRESPESARAAKVGRSRELAALAEVYAIDIEAHQESACFITSPYAIVALRPAKGHGELQVRVDLGRKHMLAPDCSACGNEIGAGYVCDAGHALCAGCAGACSHCGTWQCAPCGEARPATAHCPRCGQSTDSLALKQHVTEESPGHESLSVNHLDALPSSMWIAAVEWILSRQGITPGSRRENGEVCVWQAQSHEGKAVVAALRPGKRWATDATEIRQAAAHLQMGQPNTLRMIVTTSPATPLARETADQLGVRLLDNAELERVLAALASAHVRERAHHQSEKQARADAALAVRQELLDTVDAIEKVLAPMRRVPRKGTQAAAGTGASRAVASARVAIERASLVWETLLSDWLGSFGERPARDGSLVIEANRNTFSEMASRARHLQAIVLDAIRQLAATPQSGDAGYTAWRQAILDECAARCDAWRWRIRTYDPAAWADFARAWNAKAAAKAAEATTAAGHATARADKAQAQALRAS